MPIAAEQEASTTKVWLLGPRQAMAPSQQAHRTIPANLSNAGTRAKSADGLSAKSGVAECGPRRPLLLMPVLSKASMSTVRHIRGSRHEFIANQTTTFSWGPSEQSVSARADPRFVCDLTGEASPELRWRKCSSGSEPSSSQHVKRVLWLAQT